MRVYIRSENKWIYIFPNQKCNHPRPGFELVLPWLFPLMITIMPRSCIYACRCECVYISLRAYRLTLFACICMWIRSISVWFQKMIKYKEKDIAMKGLFSNKLKSSNIVLSKVSRQFFNYFILYFKFGLNFFILIYLFIYLLVRGPQEKRFLFRKLEHHISRKVTRNWKGNDSEVCQPSAVVGCKNIDMIFCLKISRTFDVNYSLKPITNQLCILLDVKCYI